MVHLTRIYTRGGDQGKTSLGTKKRVSKSSLRIAALGDVDEANAVLGVARLHSEGEVDCLLGRIQNDLFDLGADLCTLEEKERSLRILPSQVAFLEDAIDRYNATLPPLTSFVLPGGTPLSAILHQARTTVRRAERTAWALHEEVPLNLSTLHYLNRLSDLFFVLARYANQTEKKEVLWTPGVYQ